MAMTDVLKQWSATDSGSPIPASTHPVLGRPFSSRPSRRIPTAALNAIP